MVFGWRRWERNMHVNYVGGAYYLRIKDLADFV